MVWLRSILPYNRIKIKYQESLCRTELNEVKPNIIVMKKSQF